MRSTVIRVSGLLALVVLALALRQPAQRPSGKQSSTGSRRQGVAAAPAGSIDAPRTFVTVRVRSADDRAIAERLGTIVEDYGSMLLVSASPSAFSSARVDGGLEVRTIDPTINLRGFRFDPLVDDPEQRFDRQKARSPEAAAYFLVQFVGPANDQWLTDIKSAGAEIIQYVPHQAFIVRAAENAMSSVANHPRVRWTGPYHPDYKLGQLLREALGDSLASVANADDYEVAVFKPADLARVTKNIESIGGIVTHADVVPGSYFNLLRARLDAGMLGEVATLTEVAAIDPHYERAGEDERGAHILSGNFTNATTLYPPGYDPGTQFGVDGSGVTVAVVDDGIAIPGVGGFYITPANATNGPLRGASPGSAGHGHAVASVIGGALPYAGNIDPQGYNYGAGVAPQVQLVNIPFTAAGYSGSDAAMVNDIVATPGLNSQPAFIANNSWAQTDGHGSFVLNSNRYETFEAMYDGFVLDASTNPASLDPVLLVFSAGNMAFNGLTRPKSAKNLMAVGASENLRAHLMGSADNLDELASFSSRGPTADGRIKPDLVAPGDTVTAGRSPGGVSGGVVDTYHQWDRGTSFAAAHVSGAAALFVQFWKSFRGDDLPSPALVKAAFINGTEDMSGAGASDPVPNPHEGWGRLNLRNVLTPGVPMLYADQSRPLTDLGQTTMFSGTVGDSNRPVRVSLVWTDPPGVSDPALVNDLDLEVTIHDGAPVTYRGNMFSAGLSVAGGAADAVNNVENVFLPPGLPAGTLVTVEVRAALLNGDGILGNADFTDQQFALVAFNLTNEPPVISAITSQTTSVSQATAPIPFTITDAETLPDELVLSARSSDTNLVPDFNFSFDGSGTNRTLIVSPAANQTGTCTITVSVTDGTATAESSFELTVLPGPGAPLLLDPQWLPGGEFRLTLTGDTGFVYRVQTSLDFTNWVDVASVLLTNATVDLTNPATPGATQEFYRAIYP